MNLLNKNIGKGSYAHETPQSTEAQVSSSLPAGITMLLSVTLLLNIWEYGTTLGGEKSIMLFGPLVFAFEDNNSFVNYMLA